MESIIKDFFKEFHFVKSITRTPELIVINEEIKLQNLAHSNSAKRLMRNTHLMRFLDKSQELILEESEKALLVELGINTQEYITLLEYLEKLPKNFDTFYK